MKKGFLIISFLIVSILFIPTATSAEKERQNENNNDEKYYYGMVLKENEDKNVIKNIKNEIRKKYEIYNLFEGYNFFTFETNETLNEVKKNTDKFGEVELLDGQINTMSDQLNWGLTAVKATYDKNYLDLTGKDVNIAVIDLGIDGEQAELRNKILRKFDCGTTSIQEIGEGCREVSSDNKLISWHGTHVAGIISSNSFGVAKDSKLYDFDISVPSIDFGNDMEGTLIDGNISNKAANKAFEKILELLDSGEQIDIVNMSFGRTDPTIFDKAVLKSIYDKGTILVASTGNQGLEEVDYPAAYDFVIAVGNAKADSEINEDSNYGEEVDIAGPGTEITSTILNGETTASTGTSMAAPHISGVLALYKENYPSFSNKEISNLLFENSVDTKNDGKDNKYGYGLVNAIPPKHYVIDKKINLYNKYKLFDFANDKTSPYKLVMLSGSYEAKRAKGWNEAKKRFDYYYINYGTTKEQWGWVKADDSLNGVEKDRVKMIFTSSYINLYDEASLDTPIFSASVNPTRIGIHVSESVEEWNPEKGRYNWYKVNIPEYDIKDKWIYDPNGRIVSEVYEYGILDQIWYRQINQKNVDNSYELLNNTFNWQGATFKNDSLYEIQLENKTDVSQLYIKSQNADSYATGLSIELYDDNGNKTNKTISSIELQKGLINLEDEVKSVNKIRIINLGNELTIDEFEIFGVTGQTKEEPIINSTGTDEVYLPFGNNWVNLYSEPNAHSTVVSAEQNPDLQGKIISKSNWNPEKGEYEWLKVSITGYGEKWIRSGNFKIPGQIYDGLLDRVLFKVVQQENTSSVYGLTNNDTTNHYETELNKEGSLTIQLDNEKSNQINSMYVKVNNNFSEIGDNPLTINFIDVDGESKTKKVLTDELAGSLVDLSDLKLNDIKYIEIKNNSTARLSISEIDFFGKGDSKIYDLENQSVTLDGGRSYYNTNSDIAAKYEYANSSYTTYNITQGYRWNPDKGNYSWSKVESGPASNEFQWINYSADPLYSNGWLDNTSYKIGDTNMIETYSLSDNRAENSTYTEFEPGKFVTFNLSGKGTLQELYVKNTDNIYNKDLKMDLLVNGDKVRTLTSDDLFKERIILEEPIDNVNEIVLKNSGTDSLELREVEFFGPLEK